MRLIFEYPALDKPRTTLRGEWFQITYNLIRDTNGEEVAYCNGLGLWVVNGWEYSDIVIDPDDDDVL